MIIFVLAGDDDVELDMSGYVECTLTEAANDDDYALSEPGWLQVDLLETFTIDNFLRRYHICDTIQVL